MIKVVPIFSDANQTIGWSETYVLSTPGSVDAFVGTPPGVAGSSLASFLTARTAFLAGGSSADKAAYLRKIRVSTPGAFRDSYSYVVPTSLQRGRFNDAPNAQLVDSAEMWTRLLVDLNVQNGPHGRLFLGGIPENQVSAPEGIELTVVFSARMNVFFAYLISLGWQIRRRNNAADATAPVTPIATFTVLADNRSAALTPALIAAGGGAPPATGQVIIRGRTPSEWNGVHRYRYDVAGARLVLGPAREYLADWSGAVQTGTVQLLNNTNWRGVLGQVPLRLVKRDTGDPFVVYRGRRRRSQA